jgi:hypothetical protein
MNSTRRVLEQAAQLSARLDGRASATEELLVDSAREAGYHVTGDQRIGEADLAALLGMNAGSLANKRREGKGPPCYSLAAAGHRVTYRISDVAAWIEARRR